MTRANFAQAAETPAMPTDRCQKLFRVPKRQHIWPDRERSVDLVKPDLRQCLGDLLVGKLPWPLFLHGNAGSGKTSAALTVMDVVAMARYWTVEALMNKFKYDEAPWQTQWRFPEYPQLAVLDEVGRPQPGEGKVYDLKMVKLFTDWREHKPAIYISNYSPERIATIYDGPVTSRLTCGTVFELVDVDRRKERPEWM